MAARYIGKRNQKMRIIFDDAIREDFTEDSPDIASISRGPWGGATRTG